MGLTYNVLITCHTLTKENKWIYMVTYIMSNLEMNKLNLPYIFGPNKLLYKQSSPYFNIF